MQLGSILSITWNIQHLAQWQSQRKLQWSIAPTKNFLLLPAAKYGKSTKRSTQQPHQGKEGNSGLKAGSVWALGALCRLRSKEKLAAEKRRETHYLSNAEKEQLIEKYVEKETAGAKKRVRDGAAAIRQYQGDTEAAENEGLTSREPEQTCHQMMVAIGDSVRNITSPDHGDDGEDEDDKETKQGQLSEDDEPGWVMGRITRTVLQCMDRFQQKQMKLDELTQPGWEDTANHFGEMGQKYSTSELRIPAVVQPQTDDDAAAPAPTTFVELTVLLRIVSRISQMPQGTSRPGSSHMRLGCGKTQSNMSIPCSAPATEQDPSTFQNAKPVKLLRFDPCI